MKQRKTFILTENIVSKINELKEKLGNQHEVEIVVLAINTLYSKEFENYKAIAKAKMEKPKEALTAKAETEIGKEICRQLGGQIEDNTCTFIERELYPNGLCDETERTELLTNLSIQDVLGQHRFNGNPINKEEFNATLRASAKNSK